MGRLTEKKLVKNLENLKKKIFPTEFQRGPFSL